MACTFDLTEFEMVSFVATFLSVNLYKSFKKFKPLVITLACLLFWFTGLLLTL